MVTLLVNAKGELYTCSQLQDYIFRGREMECCSLLGFVVVTWEESYAHADEKLLDEPSNSKGGWPAHVCAHYLEEHPKTQTHRRVFCAINHNMLLHVAGPWFPCNDDANTYDFYCACMLALLKPWRTKHDIKTDDEMWANAFANFYNNATADQKRIIAGIQYYYESKTACNLNRADGDVLCETVHHVQARTDDMENAEDTMSAMEETCIPLTEQDLKLFKQDQVSPREEFHVHLAIQIAKTHGIFPSMVNPPSISSLSYRFASGDDNLKLLKWLNTMRAMTDKSLTLDQAAPHLPLMAHRISWS